VLRAPIEFSIADLAVKRQRILSAGEKERESPETKGSPSKMQMPKYLESTLTFTTHQQLNLINPVWFAF